MNLTNMILDFERFQVIGSGGSFDEVGACLSCFLNLFLNPMAASAAAISCNFSFTFPRPFRQYAPNRCFVTFKNAITAFKS